MARETFIEDEAAVNGTLIKNGGPHKNDPERLGSKGQSACQKFKKKTLTIAVTFIIVLSLLVGSVIGNIIQAEKTKKLQAILKKLQMTPSPSNGCVPGWSRHGDRCYFVFSEEKSWDLCNRSCSLYNASLVTLNCEEDRTSLKNKGGECWIDLQRETTDQPWKWQNGSIVTEFEVKGTGFCAYASGDTVSSTTCDNIRRCICRKQVNAALRESESSSTFKTNKDLFKA